MPSWTASPVPRLDDAPLAEAPSPHLGSIEDTLPLQFPAERDSKKQSEKGVQCA